MRKHVHAALAQISEDLGCPPVRVGGVSDHVHVLAHFGKGVGLSDWIKEMKRKSSLLVKDQYPTLMAFGWQAGYGLFSVDPRGLEGLGRYIDTQEIHHQKLSFQDEFRAILKENGVRVGPTDQPFATISEPFQGSVLSDSQASRMNSGIVFHPVLRVVWVFLLSATSSMTLSIRAASSSLENKPIIR